MTAITFYAAVNIVCGTNMPVNRYLEKENEKRFITYIVEMAICFSLIFEIVLDLIQVFTNSYTMNFYLFINEYVLLFLVIFCLCLKGLTKNYLAVMFMACFFLFLMGQKLVKVSEGGEYDAFLTFAYLKLSADKYFVFTNCMYFSILTFFSTYVLFSNTVDVRLKAERQKEETKQNVRRKVNVPRLRAAAEILMWICFIGAFVTQFMIFRAKSDMSYTEGYLINIDVPTVFKMANSLYPCFFFIFMATRPTKMKFFLSALCYILVEGVLQLFIGRRALIAGSVLLILWLFIYYYGYDRKKMRLSYYVFFGILGAAMLGLFILVEKLRTANSSYGADLFSDLLKFFSSTGGSDSVIANTINIGEFPKNGFAYLFEPITGALTENALVKAIIGFFTGTTVASPAQGPEYLAAYDSFSHWLSYLVNSDLYNRGYGMGSSYIAEAWLAMGFAGVCLAGIGIGWFIARTRRIKLGSDKVYINGFLIMLIGYVFTLPRSGMFAFGTDALYYLAAVIICFVIYKIFDFSVSPFKKKKEMEKKQNESL